jgi:O-succinylbenzoic acid--CoA ligase
LTALPDWLRSRASSVPEKLALVAGGKSWTFSELDDEVTRIARALAGTGVAQGDRVATILPNGPLAAMLPFATLRLGAAIVPLNTRLTDPELDWQLEQTRPRCVIKAASIDELVEGAPAAEDFNPRPELAPETVAAILYTSGTTGRPKGVMLTVGNFWWSAIGSARNLGTVDHDRWIACLPLFHIGGLSILTRSMIYGTAAEVHDRFDPVQVNASIDGGATIVSVVAVMLERILDERGERPFPSSLRTVLVGGGPVTAKLLERCGKAGLPVVQTYGLTETCSQVATLSPDDATRKRGSAGRPLHPNELSIDSTRGSYGGEILVRGPVVMAGYADQPEETSKVLVDGWLHTGDYGRLDDEGFLYVLDRRDDLIITGGENVYPAEVETVLLSHPAIEEAAVIGLPDDKWGQRPMAVIRVRQGSTLPETAELDAWCRQSLAGYKVHSEFRMIADPLPRTASGKLRRSAVRDSISGPSASG